MSILIPHPESLGHAHLTWRSLSGIRKNSLAGGYRSILKVRTTLRAWLYPRLPEFIPRVIRWGHGTRYSRAFAGLLGMACSCVLAGLLGCNQYNPYLGATPTVSSSITSITPSGANINNSGSGDILLTVNGAGFVAGSNVTWNSSGSASIQLVSNFISAAEMQADLPQSLLAAPGTFFVGVIAPGPTSGNNAGNNISNFVPFIVCSSSGCGSVVSGAESRASANLSLARLSALIQSGPRYQAVVADSAEASDETGGGIAKIFLRDTCLGAADCAPQIFPVSVGLNGADPNGPSSAPSVSADGRFVVFASEANNLVKGDTNGRNDIFLRDTCIGSASTCVPATIRLSLDPGGDEANGPSSSPVISPDGRFVAFNSSATNLVPQLANSLPAGAAPPLFLRDTCFGAAAACVPNTSLVISAAAAQK